MAGFLSIPSIRFISAAQTDGTLLGYVISGYAIDRGFLREVGRGAGAEAAFFADNVGHCEHAAKRKAGRSSRAWNFRCTEDGSSAIAMVGRERYLMASKDLTGGAGTPLQLVVMKSFGAADRAEREINWLVFWVSLLAMAAGSMLMILLARMVTRPLELLAAGVRAFGEGDQQHSLPAGGTAGSAIPEPRLCADAR